MGFNFRQNTITPPEATHEVPVYAETYPHTYTASNGTTLNAGWDSAPAQITLGEPDRRLCGANYRSNTASPLTFRWDLDSGSNPGAGNYTVDLAMGLLSFAQTQSFKLFDNAAVLIDSAAGTATAGDHWLDAGLVDRSNVSAWDGVPVAVSFASVIAKLTIAFNGTSSDNTTVAHARLTFVSAAATGNPWHLYRQLRTA